MIAPFWLETLQVHCESSPYSSLLWLPAPRIQTRTLISRPPPPSPGVSFDLFFTVLLNVLFDVSLNVYLKVFSSVFLDVSSDVSCRVLSAVLFAISCDV
jgi:hypothetical protein